MANMNAHFTKEEWTAYLHGAVIDRSLMESHLEHCAACQMVYVSAIEAQGESLPELADAGKFADEVDKRLKAGAARRLKPKSSRAKPIVQYAIAASLTILLVGSGAFQQLFDTFENLSTQMESGTNPAIAERLTDKAGRWLDGLPAMNKRIGEGNR